MSYETTEKLRLPVQGIWQLVSSNSPYVCRLNFFSYLGRWTNYIQTYDDFSHEFFKKLNQVSKLYLLILSSEFASTVGSYLL